MLILRVSGLTLAVRQGEIDEIMPLPHLAPLPEAPPIVLGAFRLGQELVLVLPLAGLLGLSGPSEGTALYHHLLLLPPIADRPRIAFLADRVTNLLHATLEPLGSGESFNGCVEGEIRLPSGELVPVIGTRHLLTAYEGERLRAFAARQAARDAVFAAGGGG